MAPASPGEARHFVVRLDGAKAAKGTAASYAIVEMTRLVVDEPGASAETLLLLDELRRLFGSAGGRTLAALPLGGDGGHHPSTVIASAAGTSADVAVSVQV